jgi:hypothetical protein
MFGVLASAAGSPLAQTQGSEVDRARRASDTRRAETLNERHADAAAGIAASDSEEKSPGERGSDGGRIWVVPARDDKCKRSAGDPQSPRDSLREQSGNEIDLCI